MNQTMKIRKKNVPKKRYSLFPPDLKYNYFSNCESYPFDSDTQEFNIKNAWWLAEFSLLSYAQKAFIEAEIRRAKFSSFRFFDSPKCKAMVASTDKYSIIAFRGTVTNNLDFFVNLVDDLSIKLMDFKSGGMVHSGFYSAFNNVWNGKDGLENYLKELKRENSRLKFYFTGHSLGAAVASIAAASFKYTHSLYTFGSPKVGNAAFMDVCKFNAYRIINNNDPIPNLPPSFSHDYESEYVHLGEIKLIDKNLILKNNIRFRDNKLTRSIHISSRIIDIVFDGEKSLLLKKNDIYNGNFDGVISSSPTTGFTRLLGKYKNIIMHNREININDHAPIYYVVNLWNIYAESL